METKTAIKTIAVRLVAFIIQCVLFYALVYGALWLCRAAWREFVVNNTQTETTSEVAK